MIISDLSADLLEASHCSIILACDDLRKESTQDSPFTPPSGEILQRALLHKKNWKMRLSQLRSGPTQNRPLMLDRKGVPWMGLDYAQIEERGLTGMLKAHIAELPETRRGEYVKFLKNQCGFPKDWSAHG